MTTQCPATAGATSTTGIPDTFAHANDGVADDGQPGAAEALHPVDAIGDARPASVAGGRIRYDS